MNIHLGVCEDNNDPQKLGRIRIRIFGLHTEVKNQSDTEGIPTEDLPWCVPIFPITGSSNSGLGVFSVPTNGSLIAVIPQDDNLQRWFYLGTIPSFPRETSNNKVGFNDPSGIFPLQDRINEPDINRLARNDKIDNTIIDIKRKEIVKNIVVASLNIKGTDLSNFESPTSQNNTFSEPSEPYNSSYPDNMVFESNTKNTWKNGHIIEIDDTLNNERIHVWHKSGTSISIHSNGQTIKKYINDSYDINMTNSIEFVNKDKIITIWGDKRELIRSNELKENYGHKREYVKGNNVKYVTGDIGIWVGSDSVDNPIKPEYEIESKKLDSSIEEINEKNIPEISKVGGNFNLKTEENYHSKIGGNSHQTIDGTFYIFVSGNRSVSKNKVGSTGTLTLEATGEILHKSRKTVRLKGNRMIPDFGVICGASICPYHFSPHMFTSRSVKVSI